MVGALVSGCSGSGASLAGDIFLVLEETFYSPPTVRMGASEFNAGVTLSSETQGLLAGTMRYFWAKVYFKS